MKKLYLILPIFLVFFSLNAQVGDLVFCFDVSGSMRYPLGPHTYFLEGNYGCQNNISQELRFTCSGLHDMSDPCIRYQKMFSALSPTLKYLSDLYNSSESSTLRDSPAKIAVIHFPDKFNNNPYFITVNKKLNDSGNPFSFIQWKYFPWNSSDQLDTQQLLNNEIDVDCSSFGTPMGAALNGVLNFLGTEPTISNANQVIFLISDGNPNGLPDPYDQNFWTQEDPNTQNSNNPKFRKVYAIGIGDDDNHYNNLQTLATNTGGQFFGWWEDQTLTYPPGLSGSFNSGESLWSNFLEKALFRDVLQYTSISDPVDIINSIPYLLFLPGPRGLTHSPGAGIWNFRLD